MAFSSLTKDMIIDILTDLNSDDMSKLKFLLMDVAEMRKLMTATNALDLFSSIENVNHLNLYDGYFLAQCFELLGRSDLVSRLGLITNEEAESIHPVNPFRCLLFKLSKGLSSDDVERLTFYCHRVFNLTRREIESINSCLDLFVLLQKRDIISVTNSCQLMRIVQLSLGSRGDLVDLVKNYYYPVKDDMTVPPKPRCDMNSNSTDDFPNIPFYTMIANPRGMCVIINNKKFIERKPEEGTDVDQARLEATFKKLGFMVVVYKDVASKDVVGIMRSISIMDHSKFNALVVCVLSYDGYNFLYRKDEKGGITYTRRPVDQGGNCFPIQGAFIFGVDDKPIPIGYLTAFFTESKCKTLAYKPKLFFIQTWQGETLQTGVHHSPIFQKNGNNVDKSIDLDNAHLSENATLQATPIQNAIFDSDSLLGYSTVFGDVSYRSRLQGSLYVKSLTENLDNHAETLDLHALMFKVKHDVSEKNIEEGEQEKKLELTTQTTLRKLLFFYPGNLK